MIDKTNLPPCPVETTLMLIGDKWKVLILRDMEENRLLTREVFPKVPLRVGYTLTELGFSMCPILDAMEKWGAKFKEKCK